MMFGRRSRLVSYLFVWALAGVILLAVPTLVSPLAERTLTPSSTTQTDTRMIGTNTTTTGPFVISGANGSFAVNLARNAFPYNQTLTIQSESATNITIVAYTGNANVLTITSSAPANVTVTSRSSGSESATAAPIASNIPDFALRLTLVLAPAVVLSSLGMVRVRRRVRRELETGPD